jgi:hypothetical protein
MTKKMIFKHLDLIMYLILISILIINSELYSYQQIEKQATIKMNDNKYPRCLKRSESFFGLHFDFHAAEDCKEIGKNTTPEMVQTIIDMVHPDFIQIDCKGHPGLSSYPTKVGNQAPGFVGDPLKIWREVTVKNGIALYLHYSGVYDNAAVKKDSTWARVNADGLRDKNMNSVFGSYVDKLLIPQFKELSDVYGVDGVWVDGDCWAVANDYSEIAIKAFQEKTGIKSIPRKPEDPYFYEFCEFNREGFKNYVKHYVDELHKHNPDFQIASNWSYSSFMPEPVMVNVDFISGDFNYENSVNSARFEGRCIANQGKPWDLMAWGFRWKGNGYQNQKSSIQLQQEAAMVISLGGGFQAYSSQNRDGSMSLWKMKPMVDLAKFCHARQKYCQYAKAVSQIALLYSSADFYRRIPNLFGGWGESSSLKGVLYSLLDAQNAVEILSEHHLKGNMQKYLLIVVPEIKYLEWNFKNELLDYVKNGGSLLILGHDASQLFAQEIGFIYKGELDKNALQWMEFDGILTIIQTPYQLVSLNTGMESIGKLYKTQDPRTVSEIAGSMVNYGKGKIASLFFDFGAQYFKGSSSVLRDYLNSIVRKLFPDPIIEVNGSHYVDVVVNNVNKKLAINLINISGPHNSNLVDVFDEIPPIGPLEVSIKYHTQPKKVTLEPEGKPLQFKYKGGKIKLIVSKVEIHEIIVVE